jgi:hypothetical protein
VISNAVRGTWLGAGTPPSGGPDRRLFTIAIDGEFLIVAHTVG